jgi:hypothetical protein
MNKYRTLRAVGFFVVLVAVLAFLALPKSQAGAAKPIRWKAIFAPITGANLTGSGEFVGGVDHVNINNGLGTNATPPPCNTAGTGLYSYLELQVFDPSLYFNMGGFLQSGGALPSSYGFPNITTDWPGCVSDFLNNNYHPTADYPHIILRFTTCGCGNSQTDLMAMKEGEILPVHMQLLFFSHIWDCPPSSPFTQKTFLNLHMNAHGYQIGATPDGKAIYDIYIQRVGNIWTAFVNTVFNNPAYPNLAPDYTSSSANWPVTISDNILGQYATCVSSPAGRNGKTTWTTTYHYPWAKAPLQFQIAFTKY